MSCLPGCTRFSPENELPLVPDAQMADRLAQCPS
jgi:hypothetical protein